MSVLALSRSYHDEYANEYKYRQGQNGVNDGVCVWKCINVNLKIAGDAGLARAVLIINNNVIESEVGDET